MNNSGESTLPLNDAELIVANGFPTTGSVVRSAAIRALILVHDRSGEFLRTEFPLGKLRSRGGPDQ